MNYTCRVSLVVVSVLIKCVFMHAHTLLKEISSVHTPKLWVKVDYSRNIQ